MLSFEEIVRRLVEEGVAAQPATWPTASLTTSDVELFGLTPRDVEILDALGGILGLMVDAPLKGVTALRQRLQAVGGAADLSPAGREVCAFLTEGLRALEVYELLTLYPFVRNMIGGAS